MTDLQKAEFEILKIFVTLCVKYHLTYYLVCGSALGAVKYSGFIPWDDDIDVAMPRDDYDKFLKLCKNELPRHIFLQNYQTEPQFPHVFSKLRNSDTTYIEKGAAHLNINHGVYIDLFPLDGHPNGRMESRIFELRKKLLTWKQYCALHDRTKMKVRIRNRIFRMLGYHKRTQKTVGQLEALYSRYDLQSSRFWCNYGNYQGKLEYAAKEQYGKGRQMTFEGLNVIVPENYDQYLTQKFGDWRADLPKERQYGHHFYEVCDLTKSYVNYTNKILSQEEIRQ